MQVIKANKYNKYFLSTLPNLPPTICQILQKQKRVPIILPNNITVLSDICMMKTISRLHFNPSKNQKSKCQPEIKWKKKITVCVFKHQIAGKQRYTDGRFFSSSNAFHNGISIPIRCTDRLNSFWGWISLILYLNDLPQKIPFFLCSTESIKFITGFSIMKDWTGKMDSK